MSPIVVFEPSGLRLEAEHDTTILQAIRRAGLRASSECGGKGSCGKCQVILHPAPSPGPQDSKHFGKSELERGMRLACQHRVRGITRVILPQTERLSKILADGHLVHSNWDMDSGNENELGVAIDLGTTTIVAYLLDLMSGTQIDYAAVLNPQVAYGEDVMTRLDYSRRGASEKKELQLAVTGSINQILERFVREFEPKEITKISVVGNTVMQHLLLAADTTTLAKAPYEPSVVGPVQLHGREIGLSVEPTPEVYVAPNIAKFVGSDTLGFIISQRLDESDGPVLGVDIGTNGEIVLANKEGIFCCSTAAGSAFEGATISHGMRGQEGAIEHVQISTDGKPSFSLIGEGPPLGICGSAIVDLVAEMRRVRIIDGSGRMNPSFARVKRNHKGELAYVLCEENRLGAKEIVFTQADVRQVQLAKAAIHAGITILLDYTRTTLDSVETLLLAGAFGNYVTPNSAMRVGLLPKMEATRIASVGNAAGEGAKRLLLSTKTRRHAEAIADKVTYVDLATNPRFQNILLSHIPLPENAG